MGDFSFLLNIFINDIALLSGTEVCNYADDTTTFVCDPDVNCVRHMLEANASQLSKMVC